MRPALVLLLLATCAPTSRAPRNAAADAAPAGQAEAGWTPSAPSELAQRYDDAGRPRPQPNVGVPAPADGLAPATIGPEPAPGPPRPPRVGRCDLRLRAARLDDAFRALADAGRFDLVLEGDFSRPVSLALFDVEPFEALAALAEAHGARLSYRKGTVIVVHER